MLDDLDKLNGETEGMDDLEAQLAALGIFDRDDDDSFGSSFGDSLSAADDDDPEAAFAALEALSGGVAAAAAPPPPPMLDAGGDDIMDLDKQLEMLLNADRAAAEDFDINSVSVASPTQSVYDPEVDGVGTVQYSKGAFVLEEPKARLFENISPWKILATAAVGLLFIAVGAFTAIWAASALREQQDYIAAVSHFTPIEMPTDVANNANAIFVNETAALGGRQFTLARISAGYSGTFFFFEENFDPDDYFILLYNQARNLYPRTTFDVQPAPGSGTVLKFCTLSHNTLFLTLHIQCRTTHEYLRFNYRFTGTPALGAPVYVNQAVPALAEDGPDMTGLVVRHAVFDNASSKVHYSFTPDPGAAGLRLSAYAGAPFVSMQDAFTGITPMTNETASLYFGDFGITIGAATFGPVMSLDSRVDVTFHGLVYHYPYPVVDIELRELFGRDQRNPHAIQTGPFTLNLEGMAQDGPLVVLVLHGLDENGRRRAAHLDVTLRVALDGGFVDMPGAVQSGERGTDVVFDMRPHGARLRDVPISQYSLIIHAVEYEVPSVSVPIQLSPLSSIPSMRRVSAELAVYEAFMGLLAYKSGEISPENIVGLSPALRSCADLFGIFAPVTPHTRPMYGATVAAGDLVGNYDYLAVVEVQWAAGEGRNLQYFHAVFQVTARSRDSIWAIADIRRL